MTQLIIYRHFFTNADCYTSGTLQVPKGIQVHSTGANNPYLKRYVQPNDGRLGANSNNNSHNRSGKTVCANAYIGKLADGTPAIYQALPWNYRCWLSGSDTKGNANRLGYIGYEICEDNLSNRDYFDKVVMDLSVKLAAHLCLQYNIPANMIRDHRELHNLGLASNHGDILHWLKKYNLTMNDYRTAVSEQIKAGIEVTYVNATNQYSPTLYTAVITADNQYPVQMRSKPTTESNSLFAIPQGTLVEVLEETNESWKKIYYSNTTGYMMSKFLVNDAKDVQVTQLATEKQPNYDDIISSLSNIVKSIDNFLTTTGEK